MGPKVDSSREIREIAIMPADLRIRDVECHQAFGKPSLAHVQLAVNRQPGYRQEDS